ncbi:TonB-dependent receptor [Pedobacter sp. MC2016-24]|uniref:TonB-dependent receptor n=1 Tax=Pedobacter sp. MC2016-24 TaxID=2780090 RepID=UPI001880368D|nr:TonB-dependent receptor [Pedobacter sp. MC2016-24]MBE9602571.1 TonB-dependent receptor [Pedobacter sp. MC2016-24]
MKFNIIVLSFLAFCLQVHGQNTHRVTGRLVDVQNQPVSYAAIYLFFETDSVHKKAVQSDSLGYFHLAATQKGKYHIQVRYIGYQSYKSSFFELNDAGSIFSIGNIQLKEDSRALNTVEIAGNKPLIVQGLDKMVINVENSVLSQGSNALELLAKAPGVSVNESGAISLKGRSGTTIMINGKLTYLSENQLSNLLKSTTSNDISKIEIMANPSSRYDAAGKGGIINMVMKKSLKTGLNGTLTGNGGVGRAARLGGGGSLNYKNEQFNIFGSYNYFYQDLKYTNAADRQFFTTQGELAYQSVQQSRETAKLRSQNFRAGIDWFLDEKNTLGFLINGGIGKYPSVQHTQNLRSDAQHNPIWDARTVNTGKERWEDMLYNLNYQHRFNDQGHELNFDLDYVSHFSKMDQHLDTRYIAEPGLTSRANTSRRGDLPSNNDIYVGKLDYTLPLGKLGKLEAGWKGSYVRTENNLKYDTLQNEVFVSDQEARNHFIYKEQIQAGYLNLKRNFGKFSVQAGLRVEYTHTEGHQVTTDSLVSRNYTKLFPSLFLGQELNEEHKMQLGYSRRIERPGYWDLNPFRIYDDPFSYSEGNPYLQPALVNAFELGYSYLSKYHLTFSFNRTSDVISNVVGVSPDGNLSVERAENLATFNNYGMSLTGKVNYNNWWSSTQFLNLFNNDFAVEEQGVKRHFKGATLTFDSQHTFKMGKGWKGELNGLYKSNERSGVFKTKAYYVISTGVQKELMEGRANVSVLVNDIFKSKQYKHYANYGGMVTRNLYRPDSRSILLSFSYRFGGDANAVKTRSTGSEDLKGRLK